MQGGAASTFFPAQKAPPEYLQHRIPSKAAPKVKQASPTTQGSLPVLSDCEQSGQQEEDAQSTTSEGAKSTCSMHNCGIPKGGATNGYTTANGRLGLRLGALMRRSRE